MGENVLQGQVKSFKKGADRALESMAAPTLFRRPDILSTTYTAIPLDGFAAVPGDDLDAYASADGQHIHLAKGHISVARIEGDGATSLLEALRQSGSPGVVTMKVKDVSAVSGFIKATIVEGNDNR